MTLPDRAALADHSGERLPRTDEPPRATAETSRLRDDGMQLVLEPSRHAEFAEEAVMRELVTQAVEEQAISELSVVVHRRQAATS